MSGVAANLRGYERNHDGRLPFAPISDLDGLRRDVAADCAIAARCGYFDEAQALGEFHGQLLSAAIWRTHAEDQR